MTFVNIKDANHNIFTMGKRSDYKKKTTKECHWCDYSYKCRKNKKCSWYKKWVKKIVDNKR